MCCNVTSNKIKLLLKFKEKWFENILSKPKLNTLYVHIEQNFGPELYVTSRLCRSQRSLVAQLRAAILPLAVEVGRSKNIPEENRLCELCDLAEDESESHFILHCTNYDDLRELIFHEMARQNAEIFWCSAEKTLGWLFNFDVFKFSNFASKV